QQFVKLQRGMRNGFMVASFGLDVVSRPRFLGQCRRLRLHPPRGAPCLRHDSQATGQETFATRNMGREKSVAIRRPEVLTAETAITVNPPVPCGNFEYSLPDGHSRRRKQRRGERQGPTAGELVIRKSPGVVHKTFHHAAALQPPARACAGLGYSGGWFSRWWLWFFMKVAIPRRACSSVWKRCKWRHVGSLVPGPLAELDLLDLPRARHGELVDEGDVPGDLEAGHAAATMRDHLLLGERAAGLELHEGHRHLDEPAIGHADHGGGL